MPLFKSCENKSAKMLENAAKVCYNGMHEAEKYRNLRDNVKITTDGGKRRS